jgi:putative addiction module killer protein
MYEVQLTFEFRDWLDGLADQRAQVRIAARLRRAEVGNLGDWKPVGGGVSEMRVDTGPGYRLYFMKQRTAVIVMLVGGDKSTQRRDIKRAQNLARTLRSPQ